MSGCPRGGCVQEMEKEDDKEIQIEKLVGIHRQIIAEKLRPSKILHYLMFLTGTEINKLDPRGLVLEPKS